MIKLKKSALPYLGRLGFQEDGYFNTVEKTILEGNTIVTLKVDVKTLTFVGERTARIRHFKYSKQLSDNEIKQIMPEIFGKGFIEGEEEPNIKETLTNMIQSMAGMGTHSELYAKTFLDNKNIIRMMLQDWFITTEGSSFSGDKATYCTNQLIKAFTEKTNIRLIKTYAEYAAEGVHLGGLNETNTDMNTPAYWCPKLIQDTDTLAPILFDMLHSSSQIARLERKCDGKTIEGDKLVRDVTPEIIASKDKAAKFHYCEDVNEFARKAKLKLREEVAEYESDNTLEELADIIEVAYAIAKKVHNCSIKNLNKIRVYKKEKNGAFDKGIVLEEII